MKLTQQKLEGWGYLIYVWWKFHNPTSTVFGWSTRVTDRRTEKLAGDSIARFYAMLSRAKNRNRQTLGLLYVGWTEDSWSSTDVWRNIQWRHLLIWQHREIAKLVYWREDCVEYC